MGNVVTLGMTLLIWPQPQLRALGCCCSQLPSSPFR